MSWWTQIWHVAKKDMIQFRWLLALQVLATAVGVAVAMDPGGHGGEPGFAYRIADTFDGWYPVLAVIAVVITALMVQADSPSRSDAFWASRPLHPLSVLAAKAATLGVFVLGLPLAAEAVVLWQHAVPLGDIAPGLMVALAVHGIIVIATATLAAVTADLGMFAISALGIGAAIAAVVGVLPRVVQGAFATASPVAVFGTGIVLGVVVLAHQYSSRNLRRSVIGGTLATVVALVALGWTSMPSGELSERAVTASPEVVRTDLGWGTFEVEPAPRTFDRGQSSSTLWTTVWLEDPDPRFEYTLRGMRARLHLADGTVTQQRFSEEVELSRPGEQPGDFDWLFPASEAGPTGARIRVAQLSPIELQSLAAQGGRLEIEGWVQVFTADEWGGLPLTVGAELVGESSRFRVRAARSPDASGPLLEFFGERTHMYPDIWRLGAVGYTRYALVNRELGQGLVAPVESRQVRGHGSVIMGGSATIASMVELDVPWVFTDGSRARAVDESWTAGAELMIIRSEPAGGYPLIAEHESVRIELDGGAAR